MNKKKLLFALLTIPASTLLMTQENNVITSITSYGNGMDISSESMMSQKNTASRDTKSQEIQVTLEQRFLCQQEGQDGGVICQMYECLNGNCQTATININENKSIPSEKESIISDIPGAAEMIYSAEKQDELTLIQEDLAQENKTAEQDTMTDKELTRKEDLSSQNKRTISEKKETTEPVLKQITPPSIDMLYDIDISSDTYEKVRKLEHEIRNAEKLCERAESDPREKAICEDASADVQWRKEKIKALETAEAQEY